MYWLVNSGTSQQPWRGDLVALYREWELRFGDVQMFPWRPARMDVGDVLVHRAVGSEGNRLVAFGDVISEPEPSNHGRWPWQVRRRLTHVCRTLSEAPLLAEVGVGPKGLRVMKAMEDSEGAHAVALISRRAVLLE